MAWSCPQEIGDLMSITDSGRWLTRRSPFQLEVMDAIAVVLFFTVALVTWLWCWERSTFVRHIDRIPGPSTKLPVLGNIFHFPRNGRELLKAFHVHWVKKYGNIYKMWRGTNAMVMLSSHQTMEVILSSQKNINKSVNGEFFVPWLGWGLLMARDDRWREDRRLLTPAFHFQILTDFFEVFNRNANIFTDLIAKKLTESPEVDVSGMISRCTLDIICEAAMGIHINAQVDSDSDYIIAIDRVQTLLRERLHSVTGFLPDWIYFKLSPQGRQCQKYIDLVHGFTSKVIRERKEQLKGTVPEDTPNKRRPFLELLILSAQQGANLSDENIRSQVDTFMFEGHDTTATAITWFLYCMATHPNEQDQVYQEIYDHFGDSDRPVTLEDLPAMKYLECCLKETMRLYPSVPAIRRRITEEVQIEGYTIPVNTTVQLQIYAAHRNEEVFPEPLSFKPERFLQDQSIGRHPYAYIPFSAGPRNCIGLKFATYEDKVILINLLRKFRFDIDPRHVPVKETLTLILKPQSGMPLLITPRV